MWWDGYWDNKGHRRGCMCWGHGGTRKPDVPLPAQASDFVMSDMLVATTLLSYGSATRATGWPIWKVVRDKAGNYYNQKNKGLVQQESMIANRCAFKLKGTWATATTMLIAYVQYDNLLMIDQNRTLAFDGIVWCWAGRFRGPDEGSQGGGYLCHQ